MNKNILIFGKGFIGSRLAEALPARVCARRIRSFRDVCAEINKHKPKVIINCIGYTGAANVDDCELQKDRTLCANVFVPLMMAEAALRSNIKFVHISSGCIYHYDYRKDRPIAETKVPDFLDLYYSRTKIYAERALEALMDRCNILIPRIRIPLDDRPHHRNILTKLIEYRHVIDLPNSITYIPDFIRALKHLLSIDACGIYNVVNKGALRYPELLEAYKKYAPEFRYRVIPYRALKLVRTNLILSTRKLEKSGCKVRDIHEVLQECVTRYLSY
jgi:dTDP-4-dehydrorhamnose reductase